MNQRMYVKTDGSLMSLEYASVTGGRLVPKGGAAAAVTGVTTDSRQADAGSLFVAIKGERFDGHDYIASAFSGGAVCALCERIPENAAGMGDFIIVGDTTAAFGAVAREHKRKINPLTAAVTGSVGKTTTKEFIYAVLSQKYKTHKTEGNYNNEIGLPFVLLGLGKEHEAAVLEMGMSGRGEIKRLSEIAEPDIAVITNIGSSHIEYLGTRENIRDAKLEILSGLKPGGKIILNGDEPLLTGVSGAFYVSLYNKTSDARVGNIRLSPERTLFDINIGGAESKDVEIPVTGAHNVLDAAYAYAVGYLCGIGGSEIREGLLRFKNAGMRQNIFKSHGVTIIEDCYNASPESVSAALEVLRDISAENGGRSVAVLGDMRELGGHSVRLHRETGRKAAVSGVDMLFTFGAEALQIAEGALEGGMSSSSIFSFGDIGSPGTLADAVTAAVREGDTVLFKASRAVELERVVDIVASRSPDMTPTQTQMRTQNANAKKFAV